MDEGKDAAAGGDEKVNKLPSANLLKKLVKAGADSDKQRSEIGGTFAQKISEAVEKNGLHAKAFKMVRSLLKMSPAKLNETLTHFDSYREKLEVDKAAGVDAFNGETGKASKKSDKKAQAESEKDDEGDAGNVTRLRTASGGGLPN